MKDTLVDDVLALDGLSPIANRIRATNDGVRCRKRRDLSCRLFLGAGARNPILLTNMVVQSARKALFPEGRRWARERAAKL